MGTSFFHVDEDKRMELLPYSEDRKKDWIGSGLTPAEVLAEFSLDPPFRRSLNPIGPYLHETELHQDLRILWALDKQNRIESAWVQMLVERSTVDAISEILLKIGRHSSLMMVDWEANESIDLRTEDTIRAYFEK